MLREEYLIKSTEELRDLFGDTSERIWTKATDSLSSPMKRFIALSPFCCIASHDSAGRSDISPRGDAPGFMKVADDRTLVLPDRPGNRRYDTFRNIFEVPEVSVIFLIPGVFDTLRVNGRAQVSHDPALLEQFPVNGKLPKIVTVITVDEAYGHCSKAIRRGHLWDGEFEIDPKSAPSLLEMMTAHLALKDEEVRETDEVIEHDIAHFMY